MLHITGIHNVTQRLPQKGLAATLWASLLGDNGQIKKLPNIFVTVFKW
jgi:hypothetical protein